LHRRRLHESVERQVMFQGGRKGEIGKGIHS
jgi:hypothetical protein